MKCTILHDLPGRLRVHLCCGRMTVSQADVLEYYLRAQDGVQEVRVYDRTQDAVVLYDAERGSILRALAVFSFAKAEAMELVPEHTSRALNREFEDKLAVAVMRRCISKLFLPAPITTALALLRSVKYIREGLSALLHGRLSVAVLDATAVTVSMVRGDFATAGSVMFMLHLGEILEEWTHKKSVADLASAMSLRVDSVWQQVNGAEVLTKITDVKPGDRIVIRTGGMIPLDGRVVEGEAMVNQSSLTGESMPVAKHPGSPVYAGTVAEEGECVISVEKVSGSGRYDRVVRMIEESEKLKSTAEDKASRMADRLVPYTLGGTALTYLLTRNVTKMLSVLMVDFSCALKLAIPIAVLSAMRESSGYHISVKGGRFYADKKKLSGGNLSFVAQNASQPVLVNRKKYRGALTAVMTREKKRLTIVNALPVEEYLYGVVAKEVIPLWPDEAIKAQAVAARSFALYHLDHPQYEGFDIKATDQGQVYGGIEAEHPNTTKLVKATRGVTAVYDGEPIQAFFHSTSGGYTEAAVNVWGKDIPYLQAVKDDDKDSPNYSWTKSFTEAQLERTLKQGGYDIGKLQGIRLLPLGKAPMKWSSDRGTSGLQGQPP